MMQDTAQGHSASDGPVQHEGAVQKPVLTLDHIQDVQELKRGRWERPCVPRMPAECGSAVWHCVACAQRGTRIHVHTYAHPALRGTQLGD